MTAKQGELIEKLAELEHDQWMSWSKALWQEYHNMYRDLDEALDQHTVLRIIKERKKRWQKNWIPYNELSEEMKEHDRHWARKVLKVIDELVKKELGLKNDPK